MRYMDRSVTDVEFGGVDLSDYPDVCDAYLESARFEGDGAWLTADELELLQDQCPDQVHDLVLNALHG